MKLTGNQVRAARALAEIDQQRLSELSGVSINTVRNMEARGRSPIEGHASTRQKVQNALQMSGIEFTNGDFPGVRLVQASRKRGSSSKK
jgi:transcriptional regulator with XRE-family HTH domain